MDQKGGVGLGQVWGEERSGIDGTAGAKTCLESLPGTMAGKGGLVVGKPGVSWEEDRGCR